MIDGPTEPKFHLRRIRHYYVRHYYEGVSWGSVSASFVYDADALQSWVKGTANGVTTVTTGGVYKYAGGAGKSYYAGPSGVVVMRSSDRFHRRQVGLDVSLLLCSLADRVCVIHT